MIYKLLHRVQSARETQDEGKDNNNIGGKRKGKKKGSGADMVRRRIKTLTTELYGKGTARERVRERYLKRKRERESERGQPAVYP